MNVDFEGYNLMFNVEMTQKEYKRFIQASDNLMTMAVKDKGSELYKNVCDILTFKNSLVMAGA